MPQTLRHAIAQGRPLVAPSIYDGISALLIAELGFQAAYIGSYATGATKYGLPDIGYIGLEDMADQIRRLAPVANVPIIADGEGGWGNPIHVARAVKVLERAGAAATHIEDHVFGKHITTAPVLLSVDQTVDKIKAALDARDSEEFMIIGRTDSPYSEGQDAAVDRALAYQEAGADGLFVAGYIDADHQTTLKAEARVPIFTVNFPKLSAAQHDADVVLYFALTHSAAITGMRTALETLLHEGSTVSVEDGLESIQGFDRFLGIEHAREQARAYGLLS
jgi:2-methylisocitrate lyase-like PEP mutase family enzyme